MESIKGLEQPKAPKRLKIGALYEFCQLTNRGELMIEGESWQGWVRREYAKYWLVENTLGFCTTVHKHSIGVDWRVRQI